MRPAGVTSAGGGASASVHPGRAAWKSLLPWLGVIIFLGVFFFYPLARILWVGLNPAALLAIQANSLLVIRDTSLFTFYQSILSTLLTLALGLPAAFLFARYDFRGKSFLRTLTAIPFMLPTVVVAAGFTALLGPRGWMNLALMHLFGLATPPVVFTGTLGAILLAHIFYNTTIVIRIVGNAIAHLDPRLEQAARTLGANPPRVFWRVTLALLRPSILAAALLVFIFDFTSFGVILLLGGPGFSTLEVAIYTQAMSFFNLPLAALLSLIQLLCTLAFSILYSRLLPRTVVSVTPRANALHPSRIPCSSDISFPFFPFCCLFFTFCRSLPCPCARFYGSKRMKANADRSNYGLTGDYYSELFVNRNDSIFYVPPFEAIGNSLGYAGLTVILSLVLGFPVASGACPSWTPRRACLTRCSCCPWEPLR